MIIRQLRSNRPVLSGTGYPASLEIRSIVVSGPIIYRIVFSHFLAANKKPGSRRSGDDFSGEWLTGDTILKRNVY
jgi:hypothetical protein